MNADRPVRRAARQHVLGRLKTVVLRQLHQSRSEDELDPDALLFGGGLGLDSLDAVELVVCLDADFGLSDLNPTELRTSMRTLNGLVDLVLQHTEGRHVA
jgi:acyl carrier protein